MNLSSLWTLRLWTSRSYTVLPGISVSFLVVTCCLYSQVRKPILNTPTTHHSEALIHIYQTTRRHISFDRKLIGKYIFFYLRWTSQSSRPLQNGEGQIREMLEVYLCRHVMHCFFPKGCITKTRAWILFKEVLAVLVRKHTLCEPNAQFLTLILRHIESQTRNQVTRNGWILCQWRYNLWVRSVKWTPSRATEPLASTGLLSVLTVAAHVSVGGPTS